MAKHVILGFDPASTRNIGWAVIVLDQKPKTPAKLVEWTGGTFVMETTDQKWQVLWPMFTVIEAFLEKRKPDLVILEKTNNFAGGFVTGQVSQCMGVIYAACGKHGVKVEFAFPTSVKKMVAGHGRAKKKDIKEAVGVFLTKHGLQVEKTKQGVFKFDSEHMADATANILYWLISKKVLV